MSFDTHTAALVLVMAAVTWLLRFLPFLVFRRRVPAYVAYLGRVLPAAIIGMLVVYCLKDVDPAAAPHGLPELIAGAMVVMGATLMLIGGIGLVLTRSEERESETEVARATRTSSDRLRRPPFPKGKA